MRRTSVMLGVCLLGLSPATASAIQRPEHLRGRAQLELAPTIGAAPRQARVQTPARVGSPELAAFAAELGPGALLQFDADTGVLASAIAHGLVVGGPIDAFAREFVARHIQVLAPGSTIADFVVVSDELGASGVRTIGFAQHHGGVPVIGGQLSLSFAHGRLVALRSLALPHVATAAQVVGVTPSGEQARAWIAADFITSARANGATQLDLARVETSPSGPLILPIVQAGGAIDYHPVVAVEVSLAAPIGRWLVYVDAASGRPIARRSLLSWAELQINTWQRSPLGPRVAFPAALLEVAVGGQPSLTSADGLLDITAAATPVSFAVDGVDQYVVNEAGPELEIMTMLDPDSVFVWDAGDDPEQDAQLNAYVHAQIVKDYIRAIDPTFAPLELETRITVNIDDVCNAYAEDNTLNFFLAGGGCRNTGLIADVVYHEYGHIAHTLGLQPGVGLFDGGVSEGASDYLGATITNSSQIGPGFFESTDAPLRELDPPGQEWHWPEDAGEVHDEGRIIGGTLWDLRVALVAKHGQALGVAKTDMIWLDGIRRSVDTPSWYLEALITNDDDGDLQNGTPDICEINQVFAAHGLYQPLGAELELTHTELADGSLELLLDYGQPFDPCPGSIAPTATLRVRPRHAPEMVGEVVMSEAAPHTLRAVVPAQAAGTVTQFQVAFDWGNGTTAMRPDNRADEWYERYNGEVTPIWCSSFESDDGWIAGDQWSLGPPSGGSGDASAPFDGQRVAGVALPWPGTYAPNTVSRLRSPVLDVGGFESVRLQYRRWLTVEDGYWDSATITANDELVWRNRASLDEALASVHHRDREWRFHDVDLSSAIGADGQLELEFGLVTDGGLELGGWTIDALCVVAAEQPAGGCGDGYLQSYEQCDDGNLENGDGCSSGCLFELPPAPPMEPLDDGDWSPSGRDCACTSEQGDAGGLLGLAALALLGVRRRRRARRTTAWRRRSGGPAAR